MLSLAGVLVSAFVLREHYSNETSPCKINDVWDCGTVNHSPYAEFRGARELEVMRVHVFLGAAPQKRRLRASLRHSGIVFLFAYPGLTPLRSAQGRLWGTSRRP